LLLALFCPSGVEARSAPRNVIGINPISFYFGIPNLEFARVVSNQLEIGLNVINGYGKVGDWRMREESLSIDFRYHWNQDAPRGFWVSGGIGSGYASVHDEDSWDSAYGNVLALRIGVGYRFVSSNGLTLSISPAINLTVRDNIEASGADEEEVAGFLNIGVDVGYAF
jgi:hypothetical protein